MRIILKDETSYLFFLSVVRVSTLVEQLDSVVRAQASLLKRKSNSSLSTESSARAREADPKVIAEGKIMQWHPTW